MTLHRERRDWASRGSLDRRIGRGGPVCSASERSTTVPRSPRPRRPCRTLTAPAGPAAYFGHRRPAWAPPLSAGTDASEHRTKATGVAARFTRLACAVTVPTPTDFQAVARCDAMGMTTMAPQSGPHPTVLRRLIVRGETRLAQELHPRCRDASGASPIALNHWGCPARLPPSSCP